eukprot:1001360-Rhodomonas_salina.1
MEASKCGESDAVPPRGATPVTVTKRMPIMETATLAFIPRCTAVYSGGTDARGRRRRLIGHVGASMLRSVQNEGAQESGCIILRALCEVLRLLSLWSYALPTGYPVLIGRMLLPGAYARTNSTSAPAPALYYGDLEPRSGLWGYGR